jgi:hypothetical protein
MPRFPALWRFLMNARFVLAIALMLCSSLLVPAPASALDPEKQPIYTNTPDGLLCGTHSPPFLPVPCTVPAGKRLNIEHVSGYVFQPTSSATTYAVSMVVTDPALGLNGAAFHTFIATKTGSSGGSDVVTFSTPFRMMLSPGATYVFSPANALAVSGYLTKN